MKIPDQIIPSAYGNRSPISIGILFGFMNLVTSICLLGTFLCRELLGVFCMPMGVGVLLKHTGGLGPVINCWGEDFKASNTVIAHRMSGKRGVPGVTAGIDRAVILVNLVKFTVEEPNDGTIRSI